MKKFYSSILMIGIIFLSSLDLLKAQIPDVFNDSTGITIFDCFGNTYEPEQIQAPSPAINSLIQGTSCTAGIFQIDFYDDINEVGFNNITDGAARRNVICQAFSDVSALISHTNNPCTGFPPVVRFKVASPENMGLPLAQSSAYYYSYPNNNGLVESEVWKAINTGYDPFAGSAFYYYHGYLNFNFQYTWLTDLTQPIPTGFDFDLYTVALHEIIHSLGFMSLTDPNGASMYWNFRTRFDTHIMFNSGTQPMFTDVNGCLDNYVFNGTASDITSGCTNVKFVGSNAGILPIYAPSPYEWGSSLSHLDPVCGGGPYVMRAQTPWAYALRTPAASEVHVLGDIMYHTTGVFGDGTYPFHSTTLPVCGNVVAGADDFFHPCTSDEYIAQICNGGLPLTIDDFLDNDHNVDHAECITLISGSGTLSSITGNSFVFTTSALGASIVRYVPVSATGIRGNQTFIYIRAAACLENICDNYYTYCGCVPDNCNLICNGSIHTGSLGSTCSAAGYLSFPYYGWYKTHGTPDFVCSNYFTLWGITPPPTPNAIKMWAKHPTDCYSSNNIGEGVLSEAHLTQNQNYIFSFYYRRNVYDQGTDAGIVNHLYVRLVNSLGITNSFNIPTVPSVQQLVYTATDITSTDWVHATACFTSNEPWNYLWIYPEADCIENDVQEIMIDQIEIIKDEIDPGVDQTASNCLTGALVGPQTPNCNIFAGTWEWKDAFGNVVSTNQNDVLPAGTYTLNRVINADVINGNCNTTSAPITISPVDPSTVSITGVSSYNCASGITSMAFHAVGSGTGPFTYAWSPSAGLSSTTGEYVTASPTITTTYTVTAIDGNSCPATTTYVVNPSANSGSCCPMTPAVQDVIGVFGQIVSITDLQNMFPQYFNSMSFYPIDFTTSDVVMFNCHLLLNDDCHFTNSPNIILGHGVKISVADGVTVHFDNCDLKGCKYMWQGIIGSTPHTEIDIDQCNIQDANDAVEANFGTRFSVTNSIFDNNFHHLTVYNYNDAVVYPGYIANTIFECTGNLKLPFAPNTITEIPINILEVEGGGIQIGDDNALSLRNTIRQFSKSGINIKNSNVFVVNNQIINPTPYSAVGDGIHATGDFNFQAHNLLIGTNSSNGSTLFSRNIISLLWDGVFVTTNYTLDIANNNTIQNNKHAAIYFEQCFDFVRIVDNNINNCNYGIYGVENPFATLKITDNHFHFSPRQNAITITESQTSTSNDCFIFNNEIFDSHHGIYILQRSHPIIQQNYIYHQTLLVSQPYGGSSFGIRLQGITESPQVLDNYIQNTAGFSGNYLYYGIDAQFCLDATICNNYTDSYDWGIALRGPSTSSDVNLNQMLNNNLGFVMSNHADIGYQGNLSNPTDNFWSGNNSDTWAFNSNSYVDPLFYVRDLNCGYEICSAGHTGTANDILSNDDAVGVTDCNPNGMQSIKEQYAKEQINSVDSISMEEEKWWKLRSVYEWVKMDGTIDTTDSDINSFLQNMTGNTVGAFHNVANSVAQALADTNKVLPDSVKIELAKQLNEAIVTNKLIEYYKKTINRIYFETLAKGIDSFSEEQKITITEIASLCAFQYGPGVYTARAMLAIFDTTIFEDECGTDFYYRKEQPLISASEFNLYPNPASELFTLEYPYSKDCDYQFELTDVSGKILLNTKLENNKTKQQFSTKPLSSGIYFYRISCNNIILKNDKIVIVK